MTKANSNRGSQDTAVVTAEQAIAAMAAKTAPFLEKAKAVTKIRTEEDRKLVAALLITNKDLQAEIRRVFKPMKDKAHAAHQEVCDQEHDQLDPLLKEEAACKRMQNVDWQEQEDARLAKQRELQAKADKEAKQDRKEEVKALRDSGQKEAAAALAAAPMVAEQVTVENRAEAALKAAGGTFRFVLHYQVDNPELLDRRFLVPSDEAIKAAGAAAWAQFKAADPDDGKAVAMAKLAALTEVGGVHFWAVKEAADTGRRKRS